MSSPYSGLQRAEEQHARQETVDLIDQAISRLQEPQEVLRKIRDAIVRDDIRGGALLAVRQLVALVPGSGVK